MLTGEVAAVRGPDEAYTRLFGAEFAYVRRTIHVIVGDAAAAEDITQDAFVQLLLHWRKVSHYERPDAWVRRVAIRMAVRHLKREGRRQLVEASADPPAGFPHVDPDLDAAIRELPPKQRAVLVLFYFEDRPMKEIAQLMGMSESTGFVHLHRARAKLASLLGEEVEA
ncbi:MAG TPA: sigma-70 family RNA polymerase sigma factor [Actinomycetes bacterium]|nr:sigma-70 family RNA polymerase sigma factor [Actinomycetes bacterium]